MCFFKKQRKKANNEKGKIFRNVPEQKVEYSLDYIMHFFGGEGKTTFPMYYSKTQEKWLAEGEKFDSEGKIEVYHDVSLEKWRLRIQLEPDRWWFLSVFFTEAGEFDMFSLDFEAADDSHYEFTDEKKVRRSIYKTGDENLYLHDVFIRFIKEAGKGDGQNGGFELLHNIPVTQAHHYY